MIHHHIRTISLVPLMFLLLCHFFLLDSPESVFQFYSAWLSVSFWMVDLLCDWMLECFVDVGCIDLSEVYWRQHVLSRCLNAMWVLSVFVDLLVLQVVKNQILLYVSFNSLMVSVRFEAASNPIVKDQLVSVPHYFSKSIHKLMQINTPSSKN